MEVFWEELRKTAMIIFVLIAYEFILCHRKLTVVYNSQRLDENETLKKIASLNC